MLGFCVSAHTGLIELSNEFGLFHGTHLRYYDLLGPSGPQLIHEQHANLASHAESHQELGGAPTVAVHRAFDVFQRVLACRFQGQGNES